MTSGSGPRRDELERHHSYVAGDSPFQATLRLRQAKWRERNGYPIGEHRGRPLGSRLAMPWAEESLANYLTPAIGELVGREVADAKRVGKLISQPRIFNDLLSSQPLAFNLFGELALDLDLATAVCGELWPSSIGRVTSIEFEWSPGRGDAKYLDNRSAFDVAVFYETREAERGFVGIEVKYHENLQVGASTHKPRYDQVAAASGVFVDHADNDLRRPPLQQIWLDHLLALSMLQADDGWTEGSFVLLHPAENSRCVKVGDAYRDHISAPATFERVTIERVVAAMKLHTDATWPAAFADRYLP